MAALAICVFSGTGVLARQADAFNATAWTATDVDVVPVQWVATPALRAGRLSGLFATRSAVTAARFLDCVFGCESVAVLASRTRRCLVSQAPFASTDCALPRAVGADVDRIGREEVPPPAGRAKWLGMNGLVFARGDGPNMEWVRATPHLADVVQVTPIRYRADVVLVADSMDRVRSVGSIESATHAEISVAISIHRAAPQPTSTVVIDMDFGAEPREFSGIHGVAPCSVSLDPDPVLVTYKERTYSARRFL